MENKDLYIENLPQKPLGEAIFELQWALKLIEQGGQRDPGFNILYGRFYDHLKSEYPFIEDLDASRMPEEMIPHVVRHRFRPATGAWPVVQIGPGIMTVNDTEAYTWRDYAPRVEAAIKALFEAYPFHLHELLPTVAKLTYINAVLFDPKKESMTDFLRENLHLSLNIEPGLFENPAIARNPLELNLHLAFPLTKPKGVGVLRFTNGLKNQEPALVWQIVILSGDDTAPKNTEGLSIWLKDAHDVAESWFFRLIQGKLLRSFEVGHEHNRS